MKRHCRYESKPRSPKNLRILLQQTLYRAQMAFGDKSLIVETFRGSEISQLRGIDLILPVQAEAFLLPALERCAVGRRVPDGTGAYCPAITSKTLMTTSLILINSQQNEGTSCYLLIRSA